MKVILVVALVLGVVVLAAGAWVWWHLFRPLPSDADLRARFNQHRMEFDELAQLARADSQLVGASHDWMLLRFTVFVRDTPQFNRMLTDGEVAASGRSTYRRLLDRAGVPAISRSQDGNLVWFVGMSNFNARKGIVYSEKPLTPVVVSLDSLERANDRYVSPGYLPLAPRWSLFLHPRD